MLPQSLSIDSGNNTGVVASTTIRTTHSFSARLDPHGDVNAAYGGSSSACVAPPQSWDISLRLASYGSEPPSMLIGLGPRLAHSDAADDIAPANEDADETAPPRETQRMFERRVLSTPMVWEEPDFLFFECSDRGAFVWSDALQKYGEPLVVLASMDGTTPERKDVSSAPLPVKCFHYSNERKRWLAEVRLRWTPSDGTTADLAATPCGGTFHFDVSASSPEALHSEDAMATAAVKPQHNGVSEGAKRHAWVRAASGVHSSIDRRLGVAPYVTLLNHVPSQALILPLL